MYQIISKAKGVITGHLGSQAYLHRIGCPEEEDENIEQLLCHCLAFINFRKHFLGKYTHPDLEDTSGEYALTTSEFR